MEDSNPSQINFQESDFSHLNNEDMIFQRYTYTDHHNDQFFFFSAQDEADSKDNNSDSSHENEPDQIADSEQHSEPSIQLLSRNIPRESKKKSSFRTSKISSTIFLGSSKTKVSFFNL